MRLKVKFALLLSVIVLSCLGVTISILTRFFASDQEAYLNELQTTLAVFSERQFTQRMDFVYYQAGSWIASEDPDLAELIRKVDGAVSGELWKASHRVAVYPNAGAPVPLAAGSSRWALVASPFESTKPLVRWIGRFGDVAIALDMSAARFANAFEASHGVRSRLLFDGGKVTLTSDGKLEGRESFDFSNGNFLSRLMVEISAGPKTIPFGDDAHPFTGSFLKLETEPPSIIVVSSPKSSVDEVVWRTYRQAAWIGLGFIVIAVGIGFVFSYTLTSPLQKLVENTEKFARGDYTFSVPAGHHRRDEVGTLTRAFSQMGLDLEKTRVELRKREQLAAMGKFSSAIAHEIKNPLAGILCNVQLAMRKMHQPEKYDFKLGLELLGYVEEETVRANDILGKLMRFSRQEPSPSIALDIVGRVDRTLSMQAGVLEAAGVRLEKSLPDKAILCVASGDQLHEVLLNLIQNAIHAMEERPEKVLRVSVQVEGDAIVLSVKDSGAGMTPEVKARLFEPFFTTKAIGKGTGLGLAVIHGIVEIHRGSITVVSEPGEGAEFRIRLPLQLSSSSALAA